MGIARRRKSLAKVPLSGYVSTKSNLKEPRFPGEGSTIAEALDFLKRGRIAQCADLLSMRFMAPEKAVEKKNDWALAPLYELRQETTATLAGVAPG